MVFKTNRSWGYPRESNPVRATRFHCDFKDIIRLWICEKLTNVELTFVQFRRIWLPNRTKMATEFFLGVPLRRFLGQLPKITVHPGKWYSKSQSFHHFGGPFSKMSTLFLVTFLLKTRQGWKRLHFRGARDPQNRWKIDKKEGREKVWISGPKCIVFWSLSVGAEPRNTLAG